MTGPSVNLDRFWSRRPEPEEALALAELPVGSSLLELAAALRDQGFGSLVTYSPKVFVPLTELCRDVCHYCTFAKRPRQLSNVYMTEHQVLDIAGRGARAGCHEVLFTLGDKPESRYRAAREALQALGCESTVDYLLQMAGRVVEQTGLLPHINAGILSADQMLALKEVSVSQGIMLESASARLAASGGPHHGSPDKDPAIRLANIELAGQLKVPFTTGILVGIGETRQERIESLLALRELHDRYGHIQEVIIQPFRPKPGTLMADHIGADDDELKWSIAVTRIIFGPEMSVQAPPNLSPDTEIELIAAGINDFGGVSPVTCDHVNPEAPWPQLAVLKNNTEQANKLLVARLPIYPRYISADSGWVSLSIANALLRHVDASGLARTDDWVPGELTKAPFSVGQFMKAHKGSHIGRIEKHLDQGLELSETDIVQLFNARGSEFDEVCQLADELRRSAVGDTVTYVVNRNINYTNICSYRCGFCAFSKSSTLKGLRDKAYVLDIAEIVRRAEEAWERGATEVCLQGGIHPDFTGETYLEICRAIRSALPALHIHAFSPLEIQQGAATLNISVRSFLEKLKESGLSTLPGTAAEILDDEVRRIICPDKLTTSEWLEVVETAHQLKLPTTATIMFGHVDQPYHWARHLRRIRDLQVRTNGFTEFVPLPFIHQEAPLYRRDICRQGPTFRESVLMHAVSRIVLHGHISNIQASWTKMGRSGITQLLNAGVNDLGGTLMNESISRAAGTRNGQELPPQEMEQLIASVGREPLQRTTAYGRPVGDRVQRSYRAEPLKELYVGAVSRSTTVPQPTA